MQRDAQSDFGFLVCRYVAPALHAEGSRFLDQGGSLTRRPIVALVAALTLFTSVSIGAQGQSQNDALIRRAKSKVQPVYPELAKKMSIVGTVKVEVMVAPNGTVKDAKVVGGHPVLAGAALDAARKWRFEPASTESSGVIDFKFESH